jgi:hypothetical protein
VQGNATDGNFMFEIMQKDVIRVWAYVQQDAAFAAHSRRRGCIQSGVGASVIRSALFYCFPKVSSNE